MKQKLAWWKLYLFAVLTCVALFLIPPTNQLLLIVWVAVMYGGIAIWLNQNSSAITHVDYIPTSVNVPIAEFFDEDRIYLQQQGGETTDDSLLPDSHEII